MSVSNKQCCYVQMFTQGKLLLSQSSASVRNPLLRYVMTDEGVVFVWTNLNKCKFKRMKILTMEWTLCLIETKYSTLGNNFLLFFLPVPLPPSGSSRGLRSLKHFLNSESTWVFSVDVFASLFSLQIFSLLALFLHIFHIFVVLSAVCIVCSLDHISSLFKTSLQVISRNGLRYFA